MLPSSPKAVDGRQKRRPSLQQEVNQERTSRGRPNFDLPQSSQQSSGPSGKHFRASARKSRESKSSEGNRGLANRKSEEWQQLQYADRRAMYQVAVAEKRAHRESLSCDAEGNLTAKSKFFVAIQSIRESCHDVMKEKEALHILQELKGEADVRTDVQNRWRRYGHLAVSARNIKRNRFIEIQRQLKAMLKKVFADEQPKEVQNIVTVMADVNTALDAVNQQLAFLRKKAYNAEALMDGISLSVQDAIATSERLLSQAWVRQVGGFAEKLSAREGSKDTGQADPRSAPPEADDDKLPEELQRELQNRIAKAEQCFDKLRTHLKVLCALQPNSTEKIGEAPIGATTSAKAASPKSPQSPSSSPKSPGIFQLSQVQTPKSSKSSPGSFPSISSPPNTALRASRKLGQHAAATAEDAPPGTPRGGETEQTDLFNMFQDLLCEGAVGSMVSTAFAGESADGDDAEGGQETPPRSGPPRPSRTSGTQSLGGTGFVGEGVGEDGGRSRRKHRGRQGKSSNNNNNNTNDASEGDGDPNDEEGTQNSDSDGLSSSSSSSCSSGYSSSSSSSSASSEGSRSESERQRRRQQQRESRRAKAKTRAKGERGGSADAGEVGATWAWVPKTTVRQTEARNRWGRLEAAVDLDVQYRSAHGGKAQSFASAGIEAVLLLRRQKKKEQTAASESKNDKRRRVAEALTAIDSKANADAENIRLPKLTGSDGRRGNSIHNSSIYYSSNNDSSNSNCVDSSDRERRKRLDLEQHLDNLKRLHKDSQPIMSARLPLKAQQFSMPGPQVAAGIQLSARSFREASSNCLQESGDSSENSRTLWQDWLTGQSFSKSELVEQMSPTNIAFKARSARMRHVPARRELYTELPGPAPINLIHV